MELATYQALLRQAQRLTRSCADAEDALQETLLAGLRAGREDMAWLSGVLAKQAAMQVRTAVRRRRRESVVNEIVPVDASASRRDSQSSHSEPPDPSVLLVRLPPSARRLAVLALHGLDAEEIRCVLDITPTAFRQRLSRIRHAIGEMPPALQAEAIGLAYVRDPARSVDLQFGLIRRALKAALNGSAGLGSHDPDGHLLLVRGVAHRLA
ncbi:MAG: RNA polymerase sigma factor [Pseudomarimonas sp.]